MKVFTDILKRWWLIFALIFVVNLVCASYGHGRIGPRLGVLAFAPLILDTPRGWLRAMRGLPCSARALQQTLAAVLLLLPCLAASLGIILHQLITKSGSWDLLVTSNLLCLCINGFLLAVWSALRCHPPWPIQALLGLLWGTCAGASLLGPFFLHQRIGSGAWPIHWLALAAAALCYGAWKSLPVLLNPQQIRKAAKASAGHMVLESKRGTAILFQMDVRWVGMLCLLSLAYVLFICGLGIGPRNTGMPPGLQMAMLSATMMGVLPPAVGGLRCQRGLPLPLSQVCRRFIACRLSLACFTLLLVYFVETLGTQATTTTSPAWRKGPNIWQALSLLLLSHSLVSCVQTLFFRKPSVWLLILGSGLCAPILLGGSLYGSEISCPLTIAASCLLFYISYRMLRHWLRTRSEPYRSGGLLSPAIIPQR